MAAAPVYELPPVTTLTVVRDGVRDALASAEALSDANRHDDAVEALEALWVDVRHDDALALRHRLALSWSRMYRGELDEATELLEQARRLASGARFDAAQRAEVTYRRGCVAFKRGAVAEATSLFTRALDMNETAPRPRPLLAAHAHEGRSRCHQFTRDWEAAARDAERALEHATQAKDERSQAHALFQACCVAERRRDWLVARFYGERALQLYRRHGDTLATARILNNLGGIDFLLGEVATAEAKLAEAAETASAAGSEPDLAQAVNTLAHVYLRTGRHAEARVRAQRACELLEGRTDFRDELGNAQLIVARSLAAEGALEPATTWIDAAEETFTSLGSTSHIALAWLARGDLARAAGDVDTAADEYRRAADALQDVHL
ncbi:MAG TPA: tetratricopeptide repeat protein [Gaiellaceae bacterium]|nr:tetratricopeptide repeat protein [Gaiellaceae bacterium]